MTRKPLREGSQNGKYCIFLARVCNHAVGVAPMHHTGSGAAFIRSMLNRLLTLRSGKVAISLR